jgi:hypothetical protein
MTLGRGHHDQSSSAPNRQTASLVPRIIEAVLPLRYTDNARYLHARREGQYCRQNVYGNSVHQSTSSWWVAWKFLDGMRTRSPRSRTLATPLWVTENIGNLGTLRQPPMLKAWHTHGNTPHEGADFYPLLRQVREESSDGASASYGMVCVMPTVRQTADTAHPLTFSAALSKF